METRTEHTGSFLARDDAGHEFEIDVLDEYFLPGPRGPHLKTDHRERSFECTITLPSGQLRHCTVDYISKGSLEIVNSASSQNIRVHTDDPLANTYDGWMAGRTR